MSKPSMTYTVELVGGPDDGDISDLGILPRVFRVRYKCRRPYRYLRADWVTEDGHVLYVHDEIFEDWQRQRVRRRGA